MSDNNTTIKDILARAREYNFLVTLASAAWIVVSAMGALFLRGLNQLSTGEAILCAMIAALLGIWGVPWLYAAARHRPTDTIVSKLPLSFTAGLLVLFVWVANLLPVWLAPRTSNPPQETAAPPSSGSSRIIENGIRATPIAPEVTSIIPRNYKTAPDGVRQVTVEQVKIFQDVVHAAMLLIPKKRYLYRFQSYRKMAAWTA